MERRKFVIGLGALAAGGAAATGSGAFSAMTSGDRSVTVDVVDDQDGYLGLYPMGDGAGDLDDIDGNGELAELNDEGKLVIDVSGPVSEMGPWDGQGVNPDSNYHFDRVFGIANQGRNTDQSEDTVEVWISRNTTERVSFYWEGDQSPAEFGDDAESVGQTLPPGQWAIVGLEVDASGLEDGDEISGVIEISADNKDHQSTP